MLGDGWVTLYWTSVPFRGGGWGWGIVTLSRFMQQNPKISAGQMGHISPIQTLWYSLDVCLC